MIYTPKEHICQKRIGHWSAPRYMLSKSQISISRSLDNYFLSPFISTVTLHTADNHKHNSHNLTISPSLPTGLWRFSCEVTGNSSDRGANSIHIIVPIIFVFWNVNEKHFTYAGFDQFSICMLFYQLCWSYVVIFVVWYLLGKELTHICLCVWVTMNQQNSGTTGLIGVRQAYGWRIS